ncbi:MAG: response regulator [Burkholderiales bacterium]|nr:response regulator [Burkholderiales bacterium]
MTTINPQVIGDVDAQAVRVMLVDDTPENLTLLKNMLGDRGLDIFAFPSGSLALRAAEKSVPDLVLLDITMPEMDGYEVCARFKRHPQLAEVPIIFLSALTETSDKVKGFKLGAVDFITKPFQFEEVHARVSTHLQLRGLRKRLEYHNRHLQQLVDEKCRELAEAHKESRKRLAEIAHMNRNITSSVYSAAIAHDLRQPLAAILSNAEAAELFLEQDPPAVEEVKEILADIRRDDQRANQILQRMRNMLNKNQTEIEEIDINEIAEDVAKFLGAEAKMRNARIFSEPAPEAVKVLADRIQLQQVMINLVLNGMDAMADTPVEKRTIHIRVQAVEQAYAEVIVTDAGVGFEHIEHAFESFFTTKPHGLGMGLSITAALIHAHGGQIWAENNPLGASVYFRLPLESGAR